MDAEKILFAILGALPTAVAVVLMLKLNDKAADAIRWALARAAGVGLTQADPAPPGVCQGCRAERPRMSDRSLRSLFLLRIPDNNLNIRDSIPTVKPDTPAYRNKLDQSRTN